MDGWAFELGIPGGIFSLGLLGLLLAGVWWLAYRQVGVGHRRRALLVLRTVTVLIGLVLAAQPTWVGQQVQLVEGELAVLVDVSRSMGVESDEQDRWEDVRALLDRWAGDDPPPVYAFDGAVSPSSFDRLRERAPVGSDTQVGEAVVELLDGEIPDLGAVVVVSDGADRGSQASEWSEGGVRLHTVSVGDADLRDDAIIELQADPVGFLRQEAQIRVRVASHGGSGDPIVVSLRRGQEVVREALATLDENGEGEVELSFVPTRLGREVYRVTIPVVEGDAVEENNERAFLIRITRDKLRALLVAGQPSWDERFLRSFLKRDPTIDLISFFILRTVSDLTMAASDELALIPFPTDELFSEHLGSFDLVIFQNFEFGPYQMAQYLPGIRNYVLRGGSFAMVGGDLSFASGGYPGTPLAEVLPVEMPPAGGDVLVLGRFRPQFAPDLERHPLLALLPDPVANQGAWEALAELDGANLLLGPRGEESQVLLQHPTHRVPGGRPLPVLTVGTAGAGRVLALGTDTSWRWGMATAGQTGDGSAYDRFWERALRWLTKDPTLEPAQVSTDRERYVSSDRVRVTAELRDRRYLPLGDRPVRFAVESDDGETVASEDLRLDAEGRAAPIFAAPTDPGAYRVVAYDGETELADEPFLIEAGGDELANAMADPELLARLSDLTDGTHSDTASAPALDEYDTTRTELLGLERFQPFASWPFCLLAVACFLVEWVLRRRWGYS
ncbi:MAG: glutamine amidotransferase [Myxococcota bacterium]